MTFKKVIKLLILLLALIMLSQCAGAHKEGIPSYSKVKPDNLSNDIRRLEEIVKNNTDSSMLAEAHFQLALLYSSYKNPNPNYQQALKELEAYISLSPSGEVSEGIQNLLSILRELDKTIEDNKKIKQQNSLLIRESKELKESVEQLKNLDIKMEEKKKKVK